MNAFQAVKSCLTQYTRTSGRARRAEYWWWFGFSFAVTFFLAIADGLLVGWNPLMWPTIGFLVATFLPTLAVTSRRLHDSDWPGFLGIPSALSMQCGLFAMAYGENTLFLLLGPATPIVWIAGAVHLVVLVRMFLRGTPGPNRFGPNPLTPLEGNSAPSDNLTSHTRPRT